MINLHERMLPTSAGVEPATSWSPVGRRIQLSHRGRRKQICILTVEVSAKFTALRFLYTFYSPAPQLVLMHHDSLNWILKEGQQRNISAKKFEIGPVVSDKKILKVFYIAV